MDPKALVVQVLVFVSLVLFSQVNGDYPPPFSEACRKDAYPPPAKDKVGTFTLNLDLPPEDRWTGFVQPKAQEIKAMIQDIKNIIAIVVKNMTEGEKIFNELLGPMADTFPAPYGDEMKGIAKATGIPLGEVVLYNIFYEVETVCTSIVAQDETGDIYHARNLDFGLFNGWDVKNQTWTLTERLRPLISNVDYVQGGKTVAKAVHYAGYIGMLTGLKPGVLSMSMDDRFEWKGGFIGIIEWVLGQRNGQWMGFALRDAVVKATDFQSTLNFLTTVDLLAPAYIILGGNSTAEGAIISRAIGTETDNVKMIKPNEEGLWFVLETNYDNWKPPPFFDDRRTPGIECMNNMTQANVGFKGIYNVLSTKPVLNLLTTYTALMHVRDGTLETYLRYCPQPCYPW